MIGNALSSTYFDRCDIYRDSPIKVGSITRHNSIKKYSRMPCALSQNKSQVKGENVSGVTSSHKLFIEPNVDIRRGDIIDITQQGMVSATRYVAGEPFRYHGSHIEVELMRNEY